MGSIQKMMAQFDGFIYKTGHQQLLQSTHFVRQIDGSYTWTRPWANSTYFTKNVSYVRLIWINCFADESQFADAHDLSIISLQVNAFTFSNTQNHFIEWETVYDLFNWEIEEKRFGETW